MNEPDSPVSTAIRIAQWFGALRAIARTHQIAEAQTVEQQRLRRELEGLAESYGKMVDETAVKLNASTSKLVDVEARISALRQELHEIVAAHRELMARQMATESSLLSMSQTQQSVGQALTEIRGIQIGLEQQQRELGEQQRRLAPSIPSLPRAGNADAATWLYAAFEETFRGTRKEIRERLGIYVPEVRQALAVAGCVAIDVGCGRGEWLELMRTEGIPARGVDENALVVNQCREFGLDVVVGDAISYLENLQEKSACAVTAFHVVEHLSLPRQLQLFVAAHRVLATDGVLILETPNPENLIVGAWTFYMDPSHVRPLPPTLLRFLLEAAGFDVAEVRRLNFDDGLKRLAAQESWPSGVQQFLCSPRDFGVIARRAAD